MNRQSSVNITPSILRIAFLGGGNMAQAILSGLQKAKHQIDHCCVWERDTSKHAHLQQRFSIAIQSQFNKEIQAYNIWLFAVKPNDITDLCTSLREEYQECRKQQQSPLIVSIAAGVPVQAIAQALGDGEARIIRVMPNTPAAIGQAMSGAYCLPSCTSEDQMTARTILSAIGQVIFLKSEDDINKITAISGSGVAYFYYFAECLQNAAEQMGLSKEVAQLITQQTFQGAALMLDQTSHSLETLRQQVTSKGGTTEQAIGSFQKTLPQVVQQAVEAARLQAKAIEKDFCGPLKE